MVTIRIYSRDLTGIIAELDTNRPDDVLHILNRQRTQQGGITLPLTALDGQPYTFDIDYHHMDQGFISAAVIGLIKTL
jgi:hypothetical protein